MMELLRPTASVFAIQFYWITVVFIGWTLVSMFLRLKKGRFVYKWHDLPIAAKFVIATATSFVLFAIFTVIGYSLSLPAWWLGVFYIGSLLGAVVYTHRYGSFSIAQYARTLLRIISGIKPASPLVILLVLLAIDLFMTFFIGGFMGGDGFIHVSKIRHIMDNGFTLTDAYYGTVPETRHTVSVLHTLLAVPSWFGINPITSWYASAVFFKLVKTSAIFYLAWRLLHFVKGNLRLQYASLATIISLAIFNNYFISYPAIFVAAWIILFIIALFDMAERRNAWLLVFASLLIAVTHPVASFASALLLVLVTLALLLSGRGLFTKKAVMSLVGSFLLLISTPLFISMLPNRMTDNVKNFAVNDFSYFQIGAYKAFSPNVPQYFTTDSFTAMPWVIALLSILGIIGLLVFTKNRRHRFIIGAIVLYVPLYLFNPLSFTVLTKELPVWAVARFTVVNQLTVVMAFFGLLLIGFAFNKLLKDRISSGVLLAGLAATTIIIFVFTQSYGAVDPKNFPNASMYAQQKSVYNDLLDISQVLPDDKNAIVLAERSWDSFIVPVVAPLRVVAIHETNSTPAADMVHRSLCFDALYKTLDPALMKQANVRYVLVKRSDSAFYDLTLHSPNLKLVKENDTRVLLKFNGENIKSAHEPACYFNE